MNIFQVKTVHNKVIMKVTAIKTYNIKNKEPSFKSKLMHKSQKKHYVPIEDLIGPIELKKQILDYCKTQKI